MKYVLLLFALLIAATSSAAESLDNLDAAIRRLDRQRAALFRDYDREKKQNEERRGRIENGSASNADVQQAYLSAARLDEMNAALNEFDRQKQNLCARWRSQYRTAVDSMLAAAERESDRKKKADAGKLLQQIQERNAQLCAETAAVAPPQWQSLAVEPYDGPREIDQKVQLLKDIARENKLRLEKLEDLYKQAQKEHRTRERAQEFIQEGTLFDQSSGVRSPGNSPAESAGNTPSAIMKTDPPPAASTPSGPEFGPEWRFSDNPKQAEEDYNKRRDELLLQQKQLLQKIAEFEQQGKDLLHP